MRISCKIRSRWLAALLIVLCASRTQSEQTPVVVVDLKALGSAPDLFIDQSDSANPQRGVLGLFWLADDRIAVAFSTTRRWSNSTSPEPLQIRLVIFDRSGKQLNERSWSFAAEGPDGDTNLTLAPGPDNSILAVHEPATTGKIPEGTFIQVLNSDTTLRQNFYIPATSAYIPGSPTHALLAVQTFYADHRVSLAWWSGHPLKAGPKLDLPRGDEETLAGPEAAARLLCPVPTFCSGILIYRPGKPAWLYSNPSFEGVPTPLVFLSPDALLVAVQSPASKREQWFIIHPDKSQTALPELPKGLVINNITGISADRRRLSLNATAEAGICGALNLWCKQRGVALVADIPSGQIIFQQTISPFGGQSALSPDGRQVAILDKNKLTINRLP